MIVMRLLLNEMAMVEKEGVVMAREATVVPNEEESLGVMAICDQ